MALWPASHFDARRAVGGVLVDESALRTSMTRLYARAPRRGQRAYTAQGVPRNRAKNTALLASITLEGGMGESAAIEGATGAEVFEAYVERFLAPTLEEGGQVGWCSTGSGGTGRRG